MIKLSNNYTLVELLIVVFILSLISSLIIDNTTDAINEVNYRKNNVVFKNIRTALNSNFVRDNSAIPKNLLLLLYQNSIASRFRYNETLQTGYGWDGPYYNNNYIDNRGRRIIRDYFDNDNTDDNNFGWNIISSSNKFELTNDGDPYSSGDYSVNNELLIEREYNNNIDNPWLVKKIVIENNSNYIISNRVFRVGIFHNGAFSFSDNYPSIPSNESHLFNRRILVDKIYPGEKKIFYIDMNLGTTSSIKKMVKSKISFILFDEEGSSHTTYQDYLNSSFLPTKIDFSKTSTLPDTLHFTTRDSSLISIMSNNSSVIIQTSPYILVRKAGAAMTITLKHSDTTSYKVRNAAPSELTISSITKNPSSNTEVIVFNLRNVSKNSDYTNLIITSNTNGIVAEIPILFD